MRVDLTGERFGRLVVKTAIRNEKNVLWLSLCDCGNWCRPRTSDLTSGRTKSCGCLRRDNARCLGGLKKYLTDQWT
jgi:hypothetical protein